MWKTALLPLLLLSSLFRSFGQNAPATISLTQQQKKEIVDHLAAVLKQNYVYLDTALSMANYIQSQWERKAYDSLDRPGLLAAELTKDLWSVYHDGHLRIRYSPELARSIGAGSEVGAEDEKKAIAYNKQINYGFEKMEILNGDIGYLKLNEFTAVTEEVKETVQSAFSFLRHVRALVIDLRENGGGEPEMVQYICNYLFPEKTHLNDLYVRRTNSSAAFWTTPDTQITSLMSVPIYLLTSKATFSGAEEFAYDLQTQKRAVVVGEVTGGGAHPVEPRAISNGFVAFVPFARAVNPITKTNWEGKGIEPDIPSPADKALNAALEQIRNKIKTSFK